MVEELAGERLETPDPAARLDHRRPGDESVPDRLDDMEDSGAPDADDFELRPGETIHLESPAAESAARRFRDVLGRFATGVAVVTTTGEQGPVGLTVQSFASVSLDPQLVLFSIARTARSWPVIERVGTFCVNLLAGDQEQLAITMASRGVDKFAGVEWSPTERTGSPRIHGCLGFVDCRTEAVYDAGDHVLVLGRVLDLEHSDDDSALLFYRGQYGVAEPEPPQFI